MFTYGSGLYILPIDVDVLKKLSTEGEPNKVLKPFKIVDATASDVAEETAAITEVVDPLAGDEKSASVAGDAAVVPNAAEQNTGTDIVMENPVTETSQENILADIAGPDALMLR